MILVDTSVWIRHSQRPNRVLSEYLETPEILMHPMVLGEPVLDAATARNLPVDSRQESGAPRRRIGRGASAKRLIPPTHQRDG